MQLYHNKQYHDSNSGVARGDDGGGPPRAALLGGGKIEVIPKNLAKEKYFEGRNYRKGLPKSRRWPKNREAPKKRSPKKFWGKRQKSRGAANLRSTPGGRHPSYATGQKAGTILGPEMLVIYNINTGTTLQLKTIIE